MPKTVTHILLAYFLFSLPVTLSLADEKADELARHQGRWSVASMIRDDKEADAAIKTSIMRTVIDDQVVWRRDGKSFAGTRLVVNPAKSPKELDLIPDGGPATAKHVMGIYRFEDEHLIICVADPGQPRPKTFEAKLGSKQTLQTFKRAQP